MAEKKEKLSLEELLGQALVKEEDRPYDVPENWVWVRLGNIVEIIMGQSPSGLDTTDDPKYTPLIGGASDMGELYPYARRYTMKPTKLSMLDDIIVSIRATLGRPIFSDGEYCLGRGVCSIRSNVIDKKLIRYFFLNFENYLYEVSTGTTFAQVNKNDIENMKFPFPPRLEQQHIVDIIESLFEKLDTAKELVKNALDSFGNRKATILHKAFTGELTAKWREENGVSLDEWEEKELGKLIKNGPQNGLYKPQTAYGKGYKIVRIDNFYEGVINPWNTLKRLSLDENEKKIYGLENNDILINRVNSIQYLGKSALVRSLKDICVFESNVMRISLIEDMLPEYIIKYLNCEQGLKELRKNAKHAVNQASINQTDVKDAIVIVPPMKEQKEIVRILDKLLDNEQRAKELCDVIEKIDLMKKAILFRAFRGELGTNDAEEESAAQLLKEVLRDKI